MGTDIYLEFDKQTKPEKEKQYTGFSCSSGDVGYLRASIGMVEENSLLRQIFPEKYWDPDPARKFTEKDWDNYKDPPYDFKSNAKLVFPLLAEYLRMNVTELKKLGPDELKLFTSNLPAKPVKISKGQAQQIAMGNVITNMFEKMGAKVVKSNDDEDMDFKKIWSKSLIDFFIFGIQLQETGKKPRINISW